MGIRQFRPMTPATRFRSVSDFAEVTKTEPEKSLLEPLKRTGGPNNKRPITSRDIGGGPKPQHTPPALPRGQVTPPARVPSPQTRTTRPARHPRARPTRP